MRVNQKYTVQNYQTGELFAGLVGISDVHWTRHRYEAYELTKGQAEKVVQRLIKEKQPCTPKIIPIY